MLRGRPPRPSDLLPVLVVINPVSGSGNALRRYKSEVAPFFGAVGLRTEVVVTQRAGQGKDIARGFDPKKHRGIVVASGDGLLHEVLQGIMSRPDAAKVVRHIELGILPLGSGNGLSASILRDAGEKNVTDLLSAAFWVARGASRDIDVAAIECGGGMDPSRSTSKSVPSVVYSFLCVEWALFADIDIESEWLRCCGPARFTIWGIWRIMCCLRSYRGALSYLPEGSRGEGREDKTKIDDDDSGGGGAEKKDNDDNSNDFVDREILPPLSEPVPKDWITVDGNFTQFWAANTTMQSGDPLEMAPSAEFDDGVMHVTVNQDMTCCKMADLALFKFPEGLHEDDPTCLNLKTRAFRLVPDSPAPPGIMAADGEVIPYGPIQVLVHKGLARIMASPRRTKSGDRDP
eukprot:g5293.t1